MSKHLRFTNKNIDVLDPNNFRLAEPGLHVFTTFVTHFLDQNKRIGILRPELHIERIVDGSRALGINCPLVDNNYREWLLDFLYDLINKESNIGRQKIRIIQRQNGAIEIQIEPYQNNWPDSISLKSIISKRPDPEIKHTNFDISLKARSLAEEAGAQEALLVNENGLVLEGAWSNVFWFDILGKLYTTQDHILPGITRKIICEICEVEIREINLEDLIKAEEVFISQSTAGITAVHKINNQKIKVGDKNTAIKDKYEKYIIENSVAL